MVVVRNESCPDGLWSFYCHLGAQWERLLSQVRHLMVRFGIPARPRGTSFNKHWWNVSPPFYHLFVARDVSGIQQLVDGRVLLKKRRGHEDQRQEEGQEAASGLVSTSAPFVTAGKPPPDLPATETSFTAWTLQLQSFVYVKKAFVQSTL